MPQPPENAKPSQAFGAEQRDPRNSALFCAPSPVATTNSAPGSGRARNVELLGQKLEISKSFDPRTAM
eukprot:5788937-Alexandrium_andersonii.AAC.1